MGVCVGSTVSTYLVEDAASVVVGDDRKAVLRTLQLVMKLLVKVAALLLATQYVQQLLINIIATSYH